MQLDLYRICIAAKLDKEKAKRFLLDERSVLRRNQWGFHDDRYVMKYLNDFIGWIDDVTKTRKQAQWMLQLLASGSQGTERFEEDIPKYKELFDSIERYRLESKINLLDYKSYGEAAEAVEELVPAIKQSKAERISTGFVHILDYEDFEIFQITDPFVSAALGHSGEIFSEHTGKTYPGTKHWCTKDPQFYQQYADEGPLYYIYNTRSEKPYQFHPATMQLMDDYDRPQLWKQLSLTKAAFALIEHVGVEETKVDKILYTLFKRPNWKSLVKPPSSVDEVGISYIADMLVSYLKQEEKKDLTKWVHVAPEEASKVLYWFTVRATQVAEGDFGEPDNPRGTLSAMFEEFRYAFPQYLSHKFPLRKLLSFPDLLMDAANTHFGLSSVRKGTAISNAKEFLKWLFKLVGTLSGQIY